MHAWYSMLPYRNETTNHWWFIHIIGTKAQLTSASYNQDLLPPTRRRIRRRKGKVLCMMADRIGSDDPSSWDKEPQMPTLTGPLSSRKSYLQDTSIACTYSREGSVRVETKQQGEDERILLVRSRSIIVTPRSARRVSSIIISNQTRVTGQKRISNSATCTSTSKSAFTRTRREELFNSTLPSGEKNRGASGSEGGQSKNARSAHMRRRIMSSSPWSLLFVMLLISKIHSGAADVNFNSIAGETSKNRGMQMARTSSRQLNNETLSSPPSSLSSSPTQPPTTKSPTITPTKTSTSSPTLRATQIPTKRPSRGPSVSPSFQPTLHPTLRPTKPPTKVPSRSPTSFPTSIPSSQPTALPTISPTSVPTSLPSQGPSLKPSFLPSLRPSLKPTSSPTISTAPSILPTRRATPNPTIMPTLSGHPSSVPTSIPTVWPTSSPTISKQPTVSPSMSILPSPGPSAVPTETPTNVPTLLPTLRPSNYPTTTNKPSNTPTEGPTVTQRPSISQSPSAQPSSSPTEIPTGMPSGTPTDRPTSKPSISMVPSKSPSSQPTDVPSISSMPSSEPSRGPTVEPTYAETIVSQSSFSQILILNGTVDVTSFRTNYAKVMETFTSVFSPRTASGDERIITTCTIEETQVGSRRKLFDGKLSRYVDKVLRRMQSSTIIVDFDMQWESKHSNVTGYPKLFDDLMEKNTTFVMEEMNKADLNVNAITLTLLVDNEAPSPKPTGMPSDSPTHSPTMQPSLGPSVHPTFVPSARPSMIPSSQPTGQPTYSPSILPSPTPSLAPTSQPSYAPSVAPSQSPTAVPTSPPSGAPSEAPTNPDKATTVIAVSSVVGAGALFVVLGLCVRRKRRRDTDDNDSQRGDGGDRDGQRRRIRLLSPRLRNAFGGGGSNSQNPSFPLRLPSRNPSSRPDGSAPDENDDARSYDSNFMLSTGSSANDSGSDIEYDGTDNLADEFDRYKDQNLEKMRMEVQDSLSDADAMMSQALTNALMDDMDEDEDTVASVAVDPAEVEASVLCEMNDWLKMREGANDDERREFMQEGLNDMVSKVRRGILAPEDGSRIVHGSAAMLGLQLAESLPETTLIVSGMRKIVSKKDMIDAFSEFGELESAAVSSNSRGFGFVRYRSTSSCRKALERYRIGEIEVQDVGVSVRLLEARNLAGVDLTRQYSNERRNR